MEYPASLYRHGSQFLWDGDMFDALVVHSDKEAQDALGAGWAVGKPAHPPLGEPAQAHVKRRTKKVPSE